METKATFIVRKQFLAITARAVCRRQENNNNNNNNQASVAITE